MLSLLLTVALLSDVKIELPLEAHVHGTEIELGEVATITGSDPELVRRIQDLEIGYSPSPGYSRVVIIDRLRDVLRRKAPGVTVTFAGQRACRVFPEVLRIPPGEIEQAARLELEDVLGLREASVRLREELREVQIPAGRIRHQLSARMKVREPRSGIVTVPVEIQVDGARYRTIWTSWEVEVFEVRPVLARSVQAGQELTPDMFERRRVRMGSMQGKSLGKHEVVGSVAKRDFAPGEEVSVLEVHRPRVVLQGDSFFLMVRRGPVNARVAAVAMDSGSIGDRVRVRTVGSERELVATIVHRDLCEIVLAP